MLSVHEQTLQRLALVILLRLVLAAAALALAVVASVAVTMLLAGAIEWLGAKVFEAGVF
jgi:hypothetical protein